MCETSPRRRWLRNSRKKNNNTGEEVVEKKVMVKLAMAKKEIKTVTKPKPKTKAPIIKKQKDEVKNGTISEKNPGGQLGGGKGRRE